MNKAVVLDTSFLITLANAARPYHETARKYWRYFLDNEIIVYLPTIVVSEFQLRQEIPPVILRSCIILPFNWNDALKAADLDFTQFKKEGQDRVALKDDIKIIAQAAVIKASHLITEDEETLFRYAATLRLKGKLDLRVIVLGKGFDESFLNDGQRELGEDFGKVPLSETGL
jgi:hypothetical protein